MKKVKTLTEHTRETKKRIPVWMYPSTLEMNVLASELDTDPETLIRMRGRCIQNVKKTCGYIAFENAARYQLGQCDDEVNADG